MFESMQNKYKCFWTHQKIIIIISEEGFNLFLQILGRQLNNFFKQRKRVFIRLINEMTFADTVATLLEILYHCCFRTLFKPKRSKEKEKKKASAAFQRYRKHAAVPYRVSCSVYLDLYENRNDSVWSFSALCLLKYFSFISYIQSWGVKEMRCCERPSTRRNHIISPKPLGLQ